MQVLLRVLHSNSNVDSVNLLPVTVIGRSTECDVRLSSSHVSRKHCRFVVQENRISIEDLGSSNGTYVNDQLIEPHQAITLTPGDKVTIGPAVFVVDYEFPTYETKAGCSSSDGTHAIPVKSFGVRQDDRKSSSDNHSDKQPALNFVESHENKSGPQNSHNDQEITSNSEVGSEAGTDFDFTDDVPDQAGSPKSEIVKKGIVKSFFSIFSPRRNPAPPTKPRVSSFEQVTPPCDQDWEIQEKGKSESSSTTDENSARTSRPETDANSHIGSPNDLDDDDNFQKFLRQL